MPIAALQPTNGSSRSTPGRARVVASGTTSPDAVRERLTQRVRLVGGVSRVALTTGTLRSAGGSG